MTTPTREELLAEAQRRGLIPNQQQPSRDELLAEAKRRGLQIPGQQQAQPMSKVEAIQKGAGMVKDFFVGDDSHDFGDVAEYRNKLNVQGPREGESNNDFFNRESKRMLDFDNTTNAIFGNDEDTEEHLRKTQPHLKWSQDPENGRSIFTDPKDGKSYYINNSGVGAKDVAKLGAQAYLYARGGKLANTSRNTATRAASQGSTQYGINSGIQKMAGREDIDQNEALLAGGLGAATEFASPYLGKVWQWAKSKLSGSKDHMSTGQKIAKAHDLNLEIDELETLGRMRNTLDNSVPDDALIAQVKHGLKLTRGQATQNKQLLSDEQLLRNQDGLMNKVTEVDNFNQNQIEKSIRAQRASFNNSNINEVIEPAINAQTARDTLIASADHARGAYKQAYNEIGDVYVKKEASVGLNQRLKNAVNHSGLFLDNEITKNTNAALRSINQSINKMNPNTKAFSLKAFEDQRKKLNNLYSPNMNNMDKKALTVVKRELDDWFYSSIDESLYKGSPGELNKLFKARELMADYMNRFNNKEGASKVIRNIIREERTPEEFSNMLVGVDGVRKANAANLVKAYKEAVGGTDSEGFNALKTHIFEKMILGKGVSHSTGETNLKGAQGLVSTLNDAFSVKGKTLMKELFTQSEANEIRSLMRSINLTKLRSDLQNVSGSGTLVTRLTSAYGGKIPLISKFYQTGKNAVDSYNIMNLPTKPMPALPTAEVLGLEQTLKGAYD